MVDTASPGRGGLNASWKKVKLETGLQIMVPLFITICVAVGFAIIVGAAALCFIARHTASIRDDLFRIRVAKGMDCGRQHRNNPK